MPKSIRSKFIKRPQSEVIATIMKPSAPRDIPLEEWAAMNQVPLRTARHWASKGRITTKRKIVEVEVTATRKQAKYFIRSNAKKPAGVK